MVSVHAVGHFAAVVHRERVCAHTGPGRNRGVLALVRRRTRLDQPPPGLAPGRAANLDGLPPAYVAVAGHDPLRDDGIRYGELLAAAGVPVEVHCAETLMHGYLGYAGVVPAATEAMDRGLVALRKALHA